MTNLITNQTGIRVSILVLILTLILLEIIWSYRTGKNVYNKKDTLTNLAIFLGFQLSKFIFYGVQYAIVGFFLKYSIATIPKNILTFSATFLLIDFIYYWYHRLSHRLDFLWAFHLIHHSSLFMNLTVAYRLNWLNAVLTPLIFIPIIILGIPVDFVIISLGINLMYQFFLHTEAIGKLGILEKIFSTPSAHRVHHGSNNIYIDKNFGGVFIVWDRIFGTYQKETIRARYGTTKGFISYNPLILNCKGFIDYFKGKLTYKG